MWRLLMLVLVASLFTSWVKAQTKPATTKVKKITDTIFVKYSMCGTVRGDTVMFDDRSRGAMLDRYFQRNTRCVEQGDSILLGIGKLYFVVDTTMRITGAWCDATTPVVIAKELIRVALKLPGLYTASIKGKKVVSVVEATFRFIDSDAEQAIKNKGYDIDFIISCWVQPKRADKNVKKG